MVSSTLRPHLTPGKDTVPTLQEGGWATGPVCTGGKTRPHRDSIPNRPARISVTIPTELPGLGFNNVDSRNLKNVGISAYQRAVPHAIIRFNVHVRYNEVSLGKF